MAICSNCGTEFEGKFCPSCGTPVAAATGAPEPPRPSSSPQPPPVQPQAGVDPSDMGGNVTGTLCYVLGFITGLLFLILEPYNRDKEVRFHAFQSIFFSVAWFVIWIAVTIVSVILTIVLPSMLAVAINGLLGLVVGAGGFVVWVLLMVKAYRWQRFVLPVIGPLAEKQA